MKLKAIILCLSISLLGALSSFAESKFDDVEIKVIPVSGNIYMLEGSGGNIGIAVGDDGVFLIDDQFAPLSEKIKAAIKTVSDLPVKYLINTHWHADHTGGNENFGQDDAIIIAHENVRARLMKQQKIEFFNKVVEPLAKEGLPEITFEESVTLHFNNQEIDIIHLPGGHTDGDSVVFFADENVVHMGDHYFQGQFPFVDLASGGNVKHYIENIKTVLDVVEDDTKVIPGHGALATGAELKKYHAILLETSNMVQERMNAGKTLEEIQKEGFNSSYDKWGKSFIKTDNWIEFVYNSFK